MDASWSVLPYYFGRYDADFERLAREDFEATIIRSGGEGLGSGLLAAQRAAPRLLIGGDCFSALPVVSAHRDEIERVYWFDAHGDFHDEATTSTGFLGGMTFATLTGRACDRLLEILGADPVDPSRCTHVGGRAWDEDERERMLAAGVELLSAPPSRIESRSHVHIDVDCLDIDEVPNVTHPSPGGFSTSVVSSFLETNAALITSVSVSAWRVDTRPPAVLVHLLQDFLCALGGPGAA